MTGVLQVVTSNEQEQAILRWLTTYNEGMPHTNGLDADTVRAVAARLVADGTITLQTLRLADKEWLLDR